MIIIVGPVTCMDPPVAGNHSAPWHLRLLLTPSPPLWLHLGQCRFHSGAPVCVQNISLKQKLTLYSSELWMASFWMSLRERIKKRSSFSIISRTEWRFKHKEKQTLPGQTSRCRSLGCNSDCGVRPGSLQVLLWSTTCYMLQFDVQKCAVIKKTHQNTSSKTVRYRKLLCRNVH